MQMYSDARFILYHLYVSISFGSIEVKYIGSQKCRYATIERWKILHCQWISIVHAWMTTRQWGHYIFVPCNSKLQHAKLTFFALSPWPFMTRLQALITITIIWLQSKADIILIFINRFFSCKCFSREFE